jgi:hypothetical protein
MKRQWSSLNPSYETNRDIILFMECPYCNSPLHLMANKKREFCWDCPHCAVSIKDLCAS